jgi:hypothetical protein
MAHMERASGPAALSFLCVGPALDERSFANVGPSHKQLKRKKFGKKKNIILGRINKTGK